MAQDENGLFPKILPLAVAIDENGDTSIIPQRAVPETLNIDPTTGIDGDVALKTASIMFGYNYTSTGPYRAYGIHTIESLDIAITATDTDSVTLPVNSLDYGYYFDVVSGDESWYAISLVDIGALGTELDIGDLDTIMRPTVSFNYAVDPDADSGGGAFVQTVTPNNRALEILPSAARTATNSTADFQNAAHPGAHFILDVTAVSGSASITLSVEGKDPVSGKYYTILTSGNIVAVNTYVFKIMPGITTATNQAAADFIPSEFRVTMTHATGDSITYSIGANFVG